MWQTVIADTDPSVAPAADEQPVVPSDFRVVSATTREQWHALVERALGDIARGSLSKIVLARAVRISADHPFDLRAVLAHLRRAQPGCIVYADRGYVGASPELLVRKVGSRVTSRPSPERASTPTSSSVRRRTPANTNWSSTPWCRLCGSIAPTCASTARRHCNSPTSATSRPPCPRTPTSRPPRSRTSSRRCTPRRPSPVPPAGSRSTRSPRWKPSRAGRYAGPCGWIDGNGDGEFVVALRGGEIDGSHAVIHAGAGIVAGSEPDAEWAETQQKLTPMLQALVRP